MEKEERVRERSGGEKKGSAKKRREGKGGLRSFKNSLEKFM